jgi:2-polyprenyl-6-methoxyphenol hydroxylase-like FAD-dependent oxidoreductase
MRVAVIGAGIAGLSAAVGLARQGIEVDVIEADAPQERTGAGISLLGNALRALGELDLADPCLEAGYGFDTIDIVDGDGNVMMSDRAPRSFRPDRPASFGILRSKLHSVLADAAADAGARFCYQCTVASIEQDKERVDLTLSTGEQLRADLVVAADGSYSSTRAAVFGGQFAPVYVGQGVWRITFRRPEHLHGLVLMRNQAGQAGGAIPLSDDLCYVFILENSAERVRIDDGQLRELMAARLAAFSAPLMRAAAESIADATVTYRPFDTLLMPTPWHRGRVVLIGDAAHALTPQMTSGGGLALEDAVVLSRLISDGRPVADVLDEFSSCRFSRVKQVYDASLQICQWEQMAEYDRSLMAKLMGDTHAFLAGPF